MPPSIRRLFRERIAAPSTFILLACFLLYTQALWNWDKVFYDWLQKFSFRPAPHDVVIIAIDDRSLQEIGHWPWARSTHADLLDKLIEAKSVLLDIVFDFPDTDNPDSDARLIEAVESHGRVVLPVLLDSHSQGGQLIEVYPFPGLADKSNKIGHAYRELDKDAVVRTGYLKGGLDEAYLSSLALALLEVTGEDNRNSLPGIRISASENSSPLIWVRDYQVWIPFAGPPGHFTYVSYLDVINGVYTPEEFRDKIVLIGATALGLHDLWPTPVSGRNAPMPGVEIIANELDALRRGLMITPMPLFLSMFLTAILIAMPAVVYPRFRNRWSLGVWPLMMVAALIVSMFLMKLRIWFPPLTAFVMVALSYVVWSLIRVIRTVTFLDKELQLLGQQPDLLSRQTTPRMSDLLSFTQQFFPVDGGILLDEQGHAKQSWGNPPPLDDSEKKSDSWRIKPPSLWKSITRGKDKWALGIRWGDNNPPDASATSAMDTVVKRLSIDEPTTAKTPVGLLQGRISKVRSATERIQFLHRFIEDTVEQMADGVIVVDDVGAILVANPVAANYLSYDSVSDLCGAYLKDAVATLKFEPDGAFENGLRQVYVGKISNQISARTQGGRDLLAQLVPFEFEGGTGVGILVNLADVSMLKERERQRRQLITFLSHDLRSPLASILAITGLAKLKEGTLAGKDLDSIEQNAHKTLRLADDFLELSQAENIEATAFTDVDVIPLAESALNSTAGHAQGKNTTMTHHLCESAMVHGDGGLLERVLTNLLSNAIKYSPESSQVELGVERTHGKIHCWVRDTGIGIAAEETPKIFDSFHRVSGQGHNEKGSGVGLSFVKTVVERHAGTINVESEVSKGSCFHLYFPEAKT